LGPKKGRNAQIAADPCSLFRVRRTGGKGEEVVSGLKASVAPARFERRDQRNGRRKSPALAGTLLAAAFIRSGLSLPIKPRRPGRSLMCYTLEPSRSGGVAKSA
jgi:hypothetical protein